MKSTKSIILSRTSASTKTTTILGTFISVDPLYVVLNHDLQRLWEEAGNKGIYPGFVTHLFSKMTLHIGSECYTYSIEK